jgi:signal peptidase I
MTLNWFLSRTVRHATQMRKHVWKILSAQRDLLARPAIEAVEASMQHLGGAITERAGKEALLDRMADLEKVANKWLKPYPNPGLRENVEVLLVAIAVAMGIRTFFLQPFKIPTGSMQPTLYGITDENLLDHPDINVPNVVHRFFTFWISGVGYTTVTAKADGKITRLDPTPRRFLLFNLWQSFELGGKTHTVWFPPDGLWHRARLGDTAGNITNSKFYQKGEQVIRLKATSGDHLFVDRLTYNFRRPKRGEIIVFETKGIPGIQEQDQFYIKRLVALGDERVRIGNDRHLVINGRQLDASTPHFELVYSFNGPPAPSKFSGHVNDLVARQHGVQAWPSLFPDGNAEVQVRPNHYMVMGDNTMNSSDSRFWGDFPRNNVIGKSFFVYWPIGAQDSRPSRFGWGHR